jgi:hypothetical protein
VTKGKESNVEKKVEPQQWRFESWRNRNATANYSSNRVKVHDVQYFIYIYSRTRYYILLFNELTENVGGEDDGPVGVDGAGDVRFEAG